MAMAYPKVRMEGDEFIQFRKDAYKWSTRNTDPMKESILDPNELTFYKQDKWIDWLT